MSVSVSKINLFLLFKLPSAFFLGIRVVKINAEECTVSVTKRWINQNPFGSLYFAVQDMAAELSTGALVNLHIEKYDAKVSMLIVSHKAKFVKRALGKITFVCQEGNFIPEVLQRARKTGEGQTFWLKSIGTDEKGDVVSEMEFEWSIKVKLDNLKIEVN